MKKITLFLSSLFVAAIINAQAPSANTPATGASVEQKADITKTLSFSEENHDFGKILYGKPVEFDVVIKNISADSVKIENVKVQCGCTTPKYEQGKTYAPGETFKVTLGFSGNAEGPFEKSVDVVFNNGMTKQIRFHGSGYKVAETPAPANSGVQKLKSSGR
ncbi:MAG TPA: DUF1573 domain-containing protein [Segetibacter sp.]|jgi:hypothetical protein